MTPPDDLLLPLPHSRIYLPLPPSLPQAAPLQEALPLLQTLAKALGLYVLPDLFASETSPAAATAPPPGPSLSPGSRGFFSPASPHFSPGPTDGGPQGEATSSSWVEAASSWGAGPSSSSSSSSWVDWVPQAAHLVCLHLLVMALGARLAAAGFGAVQGRRRGAEPAAEEEEEGGEGEEELRGLPHDRLAEVPSGGVVTAMRLRQPLLHADLSDPPASVPVHEADISVSAPRASQWQMGRCFEAEGWDGIPCSGLCCFSASTLL